MNTTTRKITIADAVLSPERFKKNFRNHPAGVAVITADPGDGPVALTATSVISVSATPPLLAFSLSSMSSASAAIRRAKTVVVHLLCVDDLEVAKLCSTSGADRFEDPSMWSRLDTGEPYFLSPNIRIRGRITGTMDVGSSTIVALEALESGLDTVEEIETSPLVYHNRTWHQLNNDSVI